MSLSVISALLAANGVQHTVVLANTLDSIMDIIIDNLETWVGKTTNSRTIMNHLIRCIKNNTSDYTISNVNVVDTARGNILVTFSVQNHKFTKNYKCLLGVDHGKIAEVSAITENLK